MLENKRARADAARVFAAVSLIVVAAAIFSCSDEEKGFIPPNNPGPTGSTDSTVFTGFLVNGANSARLDVTVETTSLAPRYRGDLHGAQRVHSSPNVGGPTVVATGILRWPGGDIALTGVYDFGADTLYLTGAGRALRGNYGTINDALLMRGTAVTPDGPGAFLLGQTSQFPWIAWCGTFTANGTSDHGTIGFVRADTTIAGMVFETGANAGMLFDGNVSSGGAPKTVFFDGSLPSTYDASGSGTLDETAGTAGGAYSFNVVNANYGTSQTGTWSATRR